MIDNVGDLGSLIETDIKNLTFIATEGENPIDIGPGHQGILRAFIAYVRYRATQPSPIGDDWNNVSQEEFDAYHISPLFNGTIYGSNPLSTNPGGSAASSTNARDPIVDFKRGITSHKKSSTRTTLVHSSMEPSMAATPCPLTLVVLLHHLLMLATLLWISREA
jgi:hypothetical protein